MMRIMYATTNPGKLKEMRRVAGSYPIELLSPADFGLNLSVPEDGTTLAENAIIKAESYRPLVPGDVAIIGDDTGVEIEALGGEPGIYVRRWGDHIHELTDEEIITLCLQKLSGLPKGKRGARFHTVLALSLAGKPTQTFDGYLEGEIAEVPLSSREPGFPFWPLFYIPKWGKMLGEIQRTKKENNDLFPTHRELAIKAALGSLNL